MSRTEKTANLLGVVIPFIGVIVAVVLLWQRWVDVTDLAILAVMYLFTAIGVTVGFHRLLTHRAFQTYPWLEHTFACSDRSPSKARCSIGSPTTASTTLTRMSKATRIHPTSDTATDSKASGTPTPDG